MPSLTPEIAVDFLKELSADIRGVVLLAADGERLAGPAALEAPARELLASAPDAAGMEVRRGAVAVFAERSRRFALVAVCGPFALPALVRYDLRTVLADLEGERPAREAA